MELNRAIIKFVLAAIDGDDLHALKTTLTIALQLADKLPSWEAETALKILFGGESDA